MDILSGAALARKIKEVCHSKGPRDLAVAFWGMGMQKALFPKLRKEKNVRIVLDTALGGTTKRALEEFNFPTPPEFVKVFNRCLHTKIYICSEGAIVGSANASSNALGCNLEGGKVEELGVWIDAKLEEDAYEKLKCEFERLWEDSREGNQSDLDRAPSRPAKFMITTGEKPNSSCFLDLVKADPGKFADTLFIIGNEKAEKEEIKAAEEKLNDLKKETPILYKNDNEFVIHYDCAENSNKIRGYDYLFFIMSLIKNLTLKSILI